ncbi:MAG: transporter substrate-binding domain-containing protein, partial [Deltaproteobacteria bacterium]|nr:transporter substrate-binding domain-containing protein [Deltaproteobacteria bacterium]
MKPRFSGIIIALTLLLAFIVHPASAASDVQKDLVGNSTIEKVLRSGKLKVGMSTFIPWAMQSKTGEWVGFEIDVAKRLAKDMGVEVEFVPTKWEGLIPSLLTGKFDLVIAGMTGTAQRALKINFTQPYDFTGTQICINKKFADKVKEPMDLNDAQFTVLSRVGVTAAETAKKLLPKAEKRLFSDNGSMVQELLNGNATAIIQSLPEPAQLV